MHLETHSYSPSHSLQTVITTTTRNAPKDSYWIVLIHGGAWRDPTQTATNYLLPVSKILPPTLPIAGIASISYRLSAHPSHPQDPQTTDPYDFRAAKHPDHILDVQDALAFLQNKYGFGDRYVLVGHSCGATLAFQSVMGGYRLAAGLAPRAILGVAGIYDLRRLRDAHSDVSAYQEFIEGAFGADENLWDEVSPAVVEGKGGVGDEWRKGRLAVLAHSVDDGLVDLDQREAMKSALGQWEEKGQVERSVETLDLKGAHDEAWENGNELAEAITFTLAKLAGSTSA
ncbi:hypothetical protein FE257_010077 [Aspergillus nanangensis]|uniref:Kynurenine formamidase n=1 Tax=Aspergillus nanangensis TaxID=2582783 RepID=A0AAD4CJ43_ASPNN|nr:hypothetical protein FE257_010077 [Aspergillus nanangensis]